MIGDFRAWPVAWFLLTLTLQDSSLGCCVDATQDANRGEGYPKAPWVFVREPNFQPQSASIKQLGSFNHKYYFVIFRLLLASIWPVTVTLPDDV